MEEVQFEQISLPTNAFQSSSQAPQSQAAHTNLSKKIVTKDVQMIKDELKKVEKFKQGFESVISRIAKSKLQCSQSIEQLKKQSTELEQKINSYQKSLEVENIKSTQSQIQSNKKKYIALWENRISIASEIDIDKLKDVDIQDRKSLANELFKWIVVAIYAETETKFYLPNFKQQLFEKDSGKDFKERLGKINAANAKEEQLIKVKDFLAKYTDIIACEELQNVEPQAQKLKNIAQIYLQCHELAKKSAQLQKSIQKSKENTLQQDEQAMKWKARHQALQERMQVFDQYETTLNNTEKQLREKSTSYLLRENFLNGFLSKVKMGEQIPDAQLDKFAQI